MRLDIIDKQYFSWIDRSPGNRRLENPNLRFSEPHLMRQDPLVKRPEDGEFRQDIAEVKGIGIGKKAEPVCSLQGADDLGDLFVFNEDLIPDGNEGLEGEGEGKEFFQGSEEFGRGNLS